MIQALTYGLLGTVLAATADMTDGTLINLLTLGYFVTMEVVPILGGINDDI
tara:strand:+ start:2502 stop:2654 length:153 start_codon:yes stop_codon:yes gene_type:complete